MLLIALILATLWYNKVIEHAKIVIMVDEKFLRKAFVKIVV